MFFRSSPLARDPGPDTRPLPLAPAIGSSPCPAPLASPPGPHPRPRKQAAKPARVIRLYREPTKPARVQATNFLRILRATLDMPGRWMIVTDLSKCYSEIAQQEGWSELRWAEIGRELAKLTPRKTIKLNRKKHVAYRLR